MDRAARHAAVLLLPLLFSARTGAEVRPPVPLRTPPLLVPEETAGSGLAPEAKVRIAIDERGRVTRVEMLSIEPSTEHDELYRTRLEQTLLRWRYAPRTRDGVPEPTELEWRVRFPSRSAPPPVVEARTDPLAGYDAELRRSVILALPVEQRRALLAAQAGKAVGLLDPKLAARAESPRFVAYTDAGGAEVAQTIANNLEAIYNTLATILFPGIDTWPENDRVQVVAYRTREEYQALLTEMPGYEWSAGFYSPAGLIAFDLQQASNDAVNSILLHETTHAFLDRHIVRRGVALPRWLGEGFADYVGNSAIRKGRLVPGKTVQNKYELWWNGVARIQTTAGGRLDEARDALRRGEGIGVPELLAATEETFYGDNRALFYATAWLFVHFLHDGEEGWAEQRFPELMLYIAEGYPPEAAFRQVYGDPVAADTEFRRYVRKF